MSDILSKVSKSSKVMNGLQRIVTQLTSIRIGHASLFTQENESLEDDERPITNITLYLQMTIPSRSE